MKHSTFLIYVKTNESVAGQVSSHVMLTAGFIFIKVYDESENVSLCTGRNLVYVLLSPHYATYRTCSSSKNPTVHAELFIMWHEVRKLTRVSSTKNLR